MGRAGHCQYLEGGERIAVNLKERRGAYAFPRTVPTVPVQNKLGIAGLLVTFNLHFLALACDFRIASKTAKMGSATLRFGLLPDEASLTLCIYVCMCGADGVTVGGGGRTHNRVGSSCSCSTWASRRRWSS